MSRPTDTDNLYVRMLQQMDLEIDQFGSSTVMLTDV